MADYKKLIPFIQKWEGGWSDDPVDKGGATMCGVTLLTYADYCRKIKKPQPKTTDLKNITKDEWDIIYKTMFWDRWKADDIENQNVANMLVDWVWCSGKYGITYPQRIVNIPPDGYAGPKTLHAINEAHPVALFAELKKSRLLFVEQIVLSNPTQQKFLNGWKNRINDLIYEIQ